MTGRCLLRNERRASLLPRRVAPLALALFLTLVSLPPIGAALASYDGPDEVTPEIAADFAAPEEGAAALASPALPSLLRLPSVGVRMEIEPVGNTPGGAMDVPSDPMKAGWYRFGPRPGEAGNAAIGGHVDWDGKVRPFWYLNLLRRGDPIEVVATDGQTFEFEVQWSRWFDAHDAPVEEIFGSTDIPEITLITCGGYFDVARHEYLSRLVVRAAISD